MFRVNPLYGPTIETARLVLRPLRDDDLDDLVAGANDPAVATMVGRVPHPYRRRDAVAFLAACRQTSTSLVSAIARNDRLIGVVGIEALRRRAELGYWLVRSHWGMGHATEAADALLAYAFSMLAVPLVRSGVFVDNPASLRVQVKLGFRRVGLGTRYSVGRGARSEHIDTVLPRARFLAGVR